MFSIPISLTNNKNKCNNADVLYILSFRHIVRLGRFKEASSHDNERNGYTLNR